jgi:hypothetical protein
MFALMLGPRPAPRERVVAGARIADHGLRDSKGVRLLLALSFECLLDHFTCNDRRALGSAVVKISDVDVVEP